MIAFMGLVAYQDLGIWVLLCWAISHLIVKDSCGFEHDWGLLISNWLFLRNRLNLRLICHTLNYFSRRRFFFDYNWRHEQARRSGSLVWCHILHGILCLLNRDVCRKIKCCVQKAMRRTFDRFQGLLIKASIIFGVTQNSQFFLHG